MAEYTFITTNRLPVRARNLLPEDAPYLVDLFENLGATSRYRRFHQAVDHVDIERVWQEAEGIAQSAVVSGRGLIAFADLPDRTNAPVGAARYVNITAFQAELAVSVRDDMQGQGIGTRLVATLVQEAKANGIKTLVGVVQNDNTPIWKILSRLGYRVTRQPEGNATFVTVNLDQTVDEDSVSIEPEVERH